MVVRCCVSTFTFGLIASFTIIALKRNPVHRLGEMRETKVTCVSLSKRGDRHDFGLQPFLCRRSLKDRRHCALVLRTLQLREVRRCLGNLAFPSFF